VFVKSTKETYIQSVEYSLDSGNSNRITLRYIMGYYRPVEVRFVWTLRKYPDKPFNAVSWTPPVSPENVLLERSENPQGILF
jgi:hypothetical protein